jgi:hypothetical protein
MSTDTNNPHVAYGRAGGRKRWAGKTQADKDEAAANARQGMRDKAVTRAIEQAQRLGITLTDEQATEAGAALLKLERTERAALATVQAAAARAASKAEQDESWGADQMIAFHALLRTWAPAVPSHMQARVLASAVRDELDAPDGFNRRRLVRRLHALVEHVKAQAAERSRQLAVPGDADGFDELFESVGKPDPGRRRGLLSDLPEDEQQELLAAQYDGPGPR